MWRGGDWTGLMMVYLVRYATLRADEAEQPAAALMSEWRSQVSTAPEVARYRFLQVLGRMESLHRRELASIADGRAEGEAELTALANAALARAGQPAADRVFVAESERLLVDSADW